MPCGDSEPESEEDIYVQMKPKATRPVLVELKPAPTLTPRLLKCMDAGSAKNLFPVLKDWSRAELLALLEDIDAHYKAADAEIDESWQKFAFRPEVFFSAMASKQCYKDFNDLRMEILGILSEISSVAVFYLGDDSPVDGGGEA